MIRSYGLFWHSDKVYWGQQGSGKKYRGNLYGARTQRSSATPIDFRQQRGIYALYSDYELVYIGQTGAGNKRLFSRLKDHLSDHLVERWDRFSWFGTQWVTQQHRLSTDNARVNDDTAKALNIMEAVVIAISEPRLNLQRGRWGDAKQYFQVVDHRIVGVEHERERS